MVQEVDQTVVGSQTVDTDHSVTVGVTRRSLILVNVGNVVVVWIWVMVGSLRVSVNVSRVSVSVAVDVKLDQNVVEAVTVSVNETVGRCSGYKAVRLPLHCRLSGQRLCRSD